MPQNEVRLAISHHGLVRRRHADRNPEDRRSAVMCEINWTAGWVILAIGIGVGMFISGIVRK